MYNQDLKNIYAIMTVKTKSTTIKFKSPQMIIDWHSFAIRSFEYIKNMLAGNKLMFSYICAVNTEFYYLNTHKNNDGQLYSCCMFTQSSYKL